MAYPTDRDPPHPPPPGEGDRSPARANGGGVPHPYTTPHIHHAPPTTIQRARQLRRNLTMPEVVLWSRLRWRPAGYKFRRQHPLGVYILDFYCHAARLAIEVDGISHDLGDRPGTDIRRDRWLEAMGILALRFTAREVTLELGVVVDCIVATCQQRGTPSIRPRVDG